MKKQIRIQIPPSAAGMRLSAYLAQASYPISADCGGKGSCGKCRVQFLGGTFYAHPDSREPLSADADGTIRSCRAWCSEDGAEIMLSLSDGGGLTAFNEEGSHQKTPFSTSSGSNYGIALDIGTTTLAAALVDLQTGAVLQTVSRLNPQRNFGADVMSRIRAASQGQLSVLCQVLLQEIDQMVHQLMHPYAFSAISHMAVVGNPTMLHLFCRVSPESMGAYPFTPAFVQRKVFRGEDLVLPQIEKITVFPSVSAFIGGDVTAGMLHLRLCEHDEPQLFIDIGTNGEMVFFTGKKYGSHLLAASAAAGPALEGAGISTGVGGIAGAVCAVCEADAAEKTSFNFTCQTIDHAPPIGICGSGLIDLIALSLREGQLDETGFLEDEPLVYAQGPDGPLSLTQEDIRAFQLAKSAMRAGAQTLLAAAGFELEQLETLYIAGGLGYYMNIQNAINVGLLPELPLSCIKSVGNSALGGAVFFLCHEEESIQMLEQMIVPCQTIDLNASAVFTEAFIEHMLFPE